MDLLDILIGAIVAFGAAGLGSYLAVTFESRVRWKNRPKLDLDIRSVDDIIKIRMWNYGKTTAQNGFVRFELNNRLGTRISAFYSPLEKGITGHGFTLHPGQSADDVYANYDPRDSTIILWDHLKAAERTRFLLKSNDEFLRLVINVSAQDTEQIEREYKIVKTDLALTLNPMKTSSGRLS